MASMPTIFCPFPGFSVSCPEAITSKHRKGKHNLETHISEFSFLRTLVPQVLAVSIALQS